MARRIEESQLGARLGRHLIGADMLGDAAGLAGHHTGLADGIQQAGLAMVDMAHDRHDRWAGHHIGVIIGHGVDYLLDIGCRNPHCLVAEFLDHQFGGVGVNGLVHRHHHAHFHQALDHIGCPLGHPVGQLLNHDGFRQLHITDHFLAHHVQAQGFLPGPFLFALHRRHRPDPTTVASQGFVQRQLAGPAVILNLGLGFGAFGIAFAVGLAWCRRRRSRQRPLAQGGGNRFGFDRRSG